MGAPPVQSDGLSWADVRWQWRPYQRAIMADTSRLRACVKARQVGLSEVEAYDGAAEMVANPRRKTFWVSTNYNKAKDLVAKVKRWVKVILVMCPAIVLTITVDNKGHIELSNGATATALPCKASSVRGETGTVRLDEVDHYANFDALYEGIAPAIASNPQLRLIMFSTPLGEEGPLHRVVTGKLGKGWGIHEVDVYRAVADGFAPSVLDLRPSYSSDMWAQEFECAFINDRDRYFSNTLLRRCFSDPSDWPAASAAKHFMGIDVGRVHDRTSWVDLGEADQHFYVYAHNSLVRNGAQLHMRDQFDQINALISSHAEGYQRVGVDATGEGRGLAQFLQSHWGAGTVQDTTQTKEWLLTWVPELKRDMERGRVHIPDDHELIAAFGKIRRVLLPGGGISFKASRDGTGHADVFYGFLHAYAQAKRLPGVRQEIVTHVRRRGRSSW